MKHHKKGRTLKRESGQRLALLRSLSRSLVEKEGITTTEARAKELKPFVERLITIAKKNSIGSRRILLSRLGNSNIAEQKLTKIIAPRYEKRSGGYTRITKLPPRLKDSAVMAKIEFV